MSHIVMPQCINCKYGDCIAVCPVDCFYEGENMVAINTEECIDCGVCVQECPVNAIIQHDPQNELHNKWLKINHEAVHKHKWPHVANTIKYPCKEKEKYAKIDNKENLLSIIPAKKFD